MGWEQYRSIALSGAQERRDRRARPPVACPNDGERLVQGKNGALDCPCGDYCWPRDGRGAGAT